MAELSESSSIPSLQPPIDLQSSNSIDDQLNSLSLQPPNDAENDGGDCDVVELEERESEGNGDEEEEERENEVESVNKSEKVNSKEEGEKKRRTRFPVRVGVEDCSFYLRTGMCKFGMNCKFNHPPGRKFQGSKVKGKEESVDVAEQNLKEKDGSLDKEGQTDCKYFDRPGGCKFGKSCKFNHNRKISPALELNFMGLPIRPGEKECPYYMRTGSCKYGANCRFNHPDPTSVGGPDMLPVYSNGSTNLSSNAPKSTLAPWSPPASLNESPPYVALMFPPTQGVPSRPEWTAYQAPAYPTETNVNMPAAYAVNGQLLDINVYASQQEQILSDEFPERPGQPECSYFLKTGNCKYRYACKFHHPKTTTAKSPPACTLSDLGLPLRPGEIVCGYYNRYGICKYGPECKYDHPVHCAHSAPMPASATDENPSSGDLGLSHGAGAAGAELEAKI